MEEKRISLFDPSIGDEDVIAFDDIVYKVAKIRSVFENLLVLTYPQLATYLNQQGASKFGLANADNSMSDLYSGNYYDFKYLKLGSSDWTPGKSKIYLSVFLYDKPSDIVEQLKAGCYYPNIFFDDNDVISLKEDCLCKMKPIKAIFSAIASSNSFASNITQQLTKSVVEFTSSNLFSTGKNCELLRLGSSSWESLIFGIQFTIDVIEDAPMVEKTILSGNIDSPLDEIRRISES
jgi:hypothetical protein